MDTLERIGFDRLGLVVAPPGAASPGVSAPLIAEFAHAGVRFANPEAITDGLAGPHRELIAHARAARGETGTFAPLFRGFPERLPRGRTPRRRRGARSARPGPVPVGGHRGRA